MVIVDWYYQAQLTEMDLICARQLLELTFVLDGSFYIQRWSDCEVYAALTFIYVCIIYIYMYVCMSECVNK